MTANRMPTKLIYKSVRAKKTVCFSFEQEGIVKAGKPIVNPTIYVDPNSGLTFDPASVQIIAEDFVDGADGKITPLGKGATVQFNAGGNLGIFEVSCTVTGDPAGEADLLECIGRISITQSPG